MRHSRTLALRGERLVHLTTDEMRHLAGGQPTPTEGISCVRCPSIPLTNCTILDDVPPQSVTCPTEVC